MTEACQADQHQDSVDKRCLAASFCKQLLDCRSSRSEPLAYQYPIKRLLTESTWAQHQTAVLPSFPKVFQRNRRRNVGYLDGPGNRCPGVAWAFNASECIRWLALKPRGRCRQWPLLCFARCLQAAGFFLQLWKHAAGFTSAGSSCQDAFARRWPYES